MKKSELRRIIMEEIQKINENKNYKYNFKHLNGGFGGIFVEPSWDGEENITIMLGIYSGGDTENIVIPSKSSDLYFSNDKKDHALYKKKVNEFKNAVSKDLVALFSKLDKDVEKVIKKHSKIME